MTSETAVLVRLRKMYSSTYLHTAEQTTTFSSFSAESFLEPTFSETQWMSK